MAIPITRIDFNDYCLRKLGHPVIRINVAPEQVEDRVDEAIQRWTEQHYDAVEETWVTYPITQVDIDNGYITLPNNILIVVQTINLSEMISGSSNMFSYKYQMGLQNLSPFQALDTLNYYMTMTNINSVYDMVNVAPRLNHTRHMNKLDVFQDLSNVASGTLIALRVYKTIDPEEYTSVYNDYWLKKYATTLIKEQWGSNMKKHGDVQLLGGVTVNGQQIYDEARQELQQLEEELETRYSLPVDFFIG